MATIRPFRALRPKKELVMQVQSPPYDVVSTEEARELAKNNPFSFLHITRPEIDLPLGIDLYDEKVYLKAKENLRKFIEDKILLKDPKPMLYLYVQRMGDRIQHGIVGVFSCEEYEKGIIKKHENTRIEKEIDRTRHIEYTDAQNGPVFLTYKARQDLKDTIRKFVDSAFPEYDFKVEGVQHTLYLIEDDKLIQKIADIFGSIDYLYIADGHHRSAAAVRVWKKRKAENPRHTGEEPYNFFLAVAFPHDELYIMDYNRVVKDLGGLSKEEFIKKVEDRFEVEEIGPKGNPYKPEKRHVFGMYLANTWFKLTAKTEFINENDPVKSLDVAILQDNLLDPILNIKNPRTDKRIEFVGGIRGLGILEEKVDKTGGVAFSMFPTSIEELMRVADAGAVMPPKSTWFEPKLRSGLFVHMLDE